MLTQMSENYCEKVQQLDHIKYSVAFLPPLLLPPLARALKFNEYPIKISEWNKIINIVALFGRNWLTVDPKNGTDKVFPSEFTFLLNGLTRTNKPNNGRKSESEWERKKGKENFPFV